MNQIATLPTRRDIVTSVSFNDLRLPYYDAFADGFGIDNIRWKVLIDTVYPSAKTVDAIAMALSYCKQRNLDPFKRPVHIVPMWSAAKGAMIETVWPGISELRTTATRTSEYAGCDAAEFGPMIKREFKGSVEKWVNKVKAPVDLAVTVEFPEWCQMTVYRVIKGQRCRFVGDKVFWIESYARQGKADVPNEMWCKRAVGQIQKCAEAAALRRAFPEEIGNEYTAEEMEGQTLFAAAPIAEIEPPKPRLPPAPPPPPPAPAKTDAPKPPAPPAQKAPPVPPQAQQTAPAAAFNFDTFAESFRNELKSVGHTLDESNDVYTRLIANGPRLTAEQIEECDGILREHCAPFWSEEVP